MAQMILKKQYMEKMLKDTQDAHLNATWGGSIYALEELRRHIDIQINKYKFHPY